MSDMHTWRRLGTMIINVANEHGIDILTLSTEKTKELQKVLLPNCPEVTFLSAFAEATVMLKMMTDIETSKLKS